MLISVTVLLDWMSEKNLWFSFLQVAVAPGGRWSRFKTYSMIQRTLEIWGFFITFIFKSWWNNHKFSYKGLLFCLAWCKWGVHESVEVTLRILIMGLGRHLGSIICLFYGFDKQMQNVFNVFSISSGCWNQ